MARQWTNRSLAFCIWAPLSSVRAHASSSSSLQRFSSAAKAWLTTEAVLDLGPELRLQRPRISAHCFHLSMEARRKVQSPILLGV